MEKGVCFCFLTRQVQSKSRTNKANNIVLLPNNEAQPWFDPRARVLFSTWFLVSSAHCPSELYYLRTRHTSVAEHDERNRFSVKIIFLLTVLSFSPSPSIPPSLIIIILLKEGFCLFCVFCCCVFVFLFCCCCCFAFVLFVAVLGKVTHISRVGGGVTWKTICNGAVAESIKWRPQQAYGSNQVLFAQPQTIFSTPKILTRTHR